MKKIITLVTLLVTSLIVLLTLLTVLLTSCEQYKAYRYELVIEVLSKDRVSETLHYPTRIDTITIIDTFHDIPHVESFRGSNNIYVYHQGEGIGQTCISTTAPINIISYKQLSNQ